MPHKLKRLLASCRRILLLLALCAAAGAAWLYWRAPSIDTLRPELKATLMERWQLRELHLGRLSWRWAGHVWLQADDVSLTDSAGHVRLKHAALSAQLSLWSLLAGHVRPVSIRVQGGSMSLQLASAPLAKPRWSIPEARFDIQDTNLTLNLNGQTWHLPGFRLHLDGKRRKAMAAVAGARLDLEWADLRTPVHIHARMNTLQWLPPQARGWLRGDLTGGIWLDRHGDAWRLQARLRTPNGAPASIRQGDQSLSFDTLELNAEIRGRDPLRPESVVWNEARWQTGKQQLMLRGEWNKGELHLRILDGHLTLPATANWGARFANDDWRAWLLRIRHGWLEQVQGEFTLPQANPWLAPDVRHWEHQAWSLKARVHKADVPLPGDAGTLSGLEGQLSADPKGLRTEVEHIALPEQAGTLRGSLRLDGWQQPVLLIAGQGEVDVARFQSWRSIPTPTGWRWRQSPALARFSLRWPLPGKAPDRGWVELAPDVAWEGDFMDRPLRLSGGALRWDADGRVRIRNMTVQIGTDSGHLEATLHASQNQPDQAWTLDSLHLRAKASFPGLVKRWHLPLDEARGEAGIELRFDRNWQLSLDLTNAGWRHLLGADKQPGEAWQLSALAIPHGDNLDIRRIASQGGFPRLQGSGAVQAGLASLNFRTIQSPAFTGGIRLRIPLGKAQPDTPLEVDVRSEFLSRQALPEHWAFLEEIAAGDSGEKGRSRPWVLHGAFQRLQWGAASMQDVEVRFASQTQGVGSLRAARLDAANLTARKVHGFFRLPGRGVVDIRELDARLPGQDVRVSGTLTPEGEDRLHWRGFAIMEGDFSSVIRRLDASGLFRGGKLHALWSGEGVLDHRQPWWHDLHGHLRLRSDEGRLLVESGTMTKLLAALNLLDLPRFLLGKRKDMSGEGLFYKRLQLEAHVENEMAHVDRLAVRASALDMAGRGKLSLANGTIDLYATVRPLQNLDALLNMIPLLRDILLGPARSVFRKVYHVYGPLQNAKVEPVDAKAAGLAGGGLLEQLFALPGRWFGQE